MLATRRIVLALTLCAILAPPAHAQINLAWNNCLGQPGAAANIQYACDGSRNGTPFRLVASFVSPASLNALAGFTLKLRIQDVTSLKYTDTPVTYPPLTDWWRLGMGECREGNLAFPTPLTGIGTGTTGTCRNPWAGGDVNGGYEYSYPDPFNPNMIELVCTYGVFNSRTLTSGQHYIAGVINLDTWGDRASESAPLCSGCCESRGIILDSIELYQEPGQSPPQQDVYYLSSAATRQHVFWQDEAPPCPTPTHRATWGSIKTTYR